MINERKKSGIAVVSIVVAVLVVALLTGVVSYVGNDLVAQAKEVHFTKDVETIHDAAEEYYAVNGSLPILELGNSFNAIEYKERIVTLLGDDVAEILENEIVENGDNQAIFYELDIEKIGIEEMSYGIKADINDYFLISNESHVVYYYPGIDINGEIYFSNSTLMK